MEFETILILSAIIEVVTLICFFVLCNNVAKIRKRICKDYLPISTILAIYEGFGDKENSRKALIDHIIHETNINEHMSRTEDINKVLNQYKNIMNELDITFDAEKAREIKRKRSSYRL